MSNRKSTMEKGDDQQQGATASLVRAVLSTEVKFVIGVVGFVIGVVAPYYQMRQDVALIQQSIATINSNHEVHIQDLTQSTKDIMTLVQSQQTQINALQLQQAVILDKLQR